MLKPKHPSLLSSWGSWGLALIGVCLLVGCASFMGAFLGTTLAQSKNGAALMDAVAGGKPEDSHAEAMQQQPMQADPAPATNAPASHAATVAPSKGVNLPARRANPNLFNFDARTRQQWQRITAICSNRNYTSCRNIDRSGWTDAARSTYTKLEFTGLGAWSTFRLQSHDSQGRKKSRGGDHWVISLREQEQKINVPARVFDEGDGSYTVAVTLLLPGKYSLWAWLWYSECLGFQEPLEDVDTIFSHHSEFFGALKKPDHCYIGQRLRMPADGKFDVPESAPKPPCMAQQCSPSAAAYAPDVKASKFGHIWRTETYHYVRGGAFFSLPCCKPRLPVRKAKDPAPLRFLFCGDSTVFHSWDIMVQATRRPCKVTWRYPQLNAENLLPDVCPNSTVAEMDPELEPILKRCTAGAPWTTVPIGADTPGSARNSRFPLYFDMKNYKCGV